MTLNIISTQHNRTRITGPKKVLDNTLKGLDKIGVKYLFNQPINEHKYNWIHDDQKAIIEAGFVNKAVLAGPNLAVLPKDLPLFRKKLPNGSIYLHPSKWTVDVWDYLGFSEAKLEYWPAGVDIDEFEEYDRKECKKVLFYFKERDLALLEKAKSILEELNLEYELIHYGFYKEEDYKRALKESAFGIWIGRQESQGIGLQEALATNLPLIILDATSLFDTVATDSKNYFGYDFPKTLKHIKTTTVPYFDDRCGIVIEDINELKKSIEFMIENRDKFKPREYIKENLSLEVSAKWLISFFEKMDIKESENYNYQKLSKALFFAGLIFQKWVWKWVFNKFGIKLF